MAWSAPKKPTTVLIVESEAVVRIELTDRLVDMGLLVLAAADADAAIALLDAHSEIQFMVTDITMSGEMDGIRLAHHVRHRWPPVRIIVTSGIIGTKLSDLPSESIFLPKPYAPEALAGALLHMMNGGGSRPQAQRRA
jgi:CheY-like chemotaxis protein